MDWSEEREAGKKVVAKVKGAVKKAVKAPMKVVDKVIEKDKKVQNFRKERNEAMNRDNFGSIENYDELVKSEAKLKNKNKKK